MNILNMAKIQLNGDPYMVEQGTNLEELLNKLKIKREKVAIELNGIIAQKSNYTKISLKKNDKVEIVQFIGGG
tara:strand:+ start:261 stop:479 length:219 start_codon:yes stop_codon:yes gene_type:complete